MKPTTPPSSSLRLAGSSANDQQDSNLRKLSRKQLINTLNRIHFAGGEINLRFKHNKFNSVITLQIKPDSCKDEYLSGRWSAAAFPADRIEFYRFKNATFTDGFKHVLVPAELIELNNEGVLLQLPEYSFETAQRKVKRYTCAGVTAQVSQDGWVVNGDLVNFTSQALVVDFHHEYSLLKNEIDPGHNLHLILKRNEEFIFSGQCALLRQENSNHIKTLVLRPVTESISRVKPKEFRSERVTLTPLPSILFEHPLTGKKIHLSLIDISGLGFSTEEDLDNSLLIPGMILPDLHIQFMHGFSVQCKSQVLYRIVKEQTVRCGLVILDMNMTDYLKLSSLIHQARNQHSYINSSNIDLDALWDFFFESGFVYPEKYEHIAVRKEKFIEVYRKLYQESPEIARHVIYQDCGKIYGHVSMYRYYQSTWLMQHHAAIKSSKHKAGLVVMDHILQYINELHSLPSARMKYIACYFRPNNRFANRVFGGAARSLADNRKCSLDDFAYFHFESSLSPSELPEPWSIEDTHPEDLAILGSWYKTRSGGLLIEGLDLGPNAFQLDTITDKDYRKNGFTRSRKFLTLRHNGDLAALFVINNADFGMNMSDLTNCIQVFVLTPECLEKKMMLQALSLLAPHYEQERIPVLLYPEDYAISRNIDYDKTYELTVLSLDHISPYLMFMKSLTSQKGERIKHVS